MIRLLVVLMAGLTLCVNAAAQPYPSKPIRLLIPFTPGGSQDVIGRLLAQKVSEAIGQPVVVENKPGAGGLIATQEEARAPADGYTLLLSTGAQMAIEPALNAKAAYDPIKDFVHVIHLGDAPLVLLAVPSLPARDVKEVVAPRDMDFLDFHWVSATRVLYRLALHQPGLSKGTATGSLLAIDRDGTHAQYVFGCRAASGGSGLPPQRRCRRRARPP